MLHDCGTCDSPFMLNINHIGNCIRLGRCRGRLFVYSLSGWTLPQVSSENQVFKELSSGPATMTEQQFSKIVKFTLTAYQTKGWRGAAELSLACDLATARIYSVFSLNFLTFLSINFHNLHDPTTPIPNTLPQLWEKSPNQITPT